MRWELSLSTRNEAGGHDLSVHLGHEGRDTVKAQTPLRIVVTLTLLAPLLWAMGLSVLQATHILSPSGSAGAAPGLIRAWAFAGPVVALGLNLWWSGHTLVRREGEHTVARTFSLSLDPVSVVLIALAGFLVVAFYGHLAADAWACSNGLRSAC
jgi:hypothetical protein